MLQRHDRNVAGLTLVAHCDWGLDDSAAWLLSLLADAPCLVDGGTVQLGWSVLTLRQRGDELWVCEPDFSTDPLSRIRPDVTITLLVLQRQREVLLRAGVHEPSALRFDDTVLLLRGCLTTSELVAHHKWEREDDDSGWYVGVEGVEASEDAAAYERLYVHQLLDLRPELLSLLALPVGYIALLDGDEVTAIVDADDEVVWGTDG